MVETVPARVPTLGPDDQTVPVWALEADRGWEVEVIPLVAGQRSVREKEWLESFRVFGIGKDDGQKIIQRLGLTLLREHEKLFGSY